MQSRSSHRLLCFILFLTAWVAVHECHEGHGHSHDHGDHQGHGHSHDHDDEKPSFKYSRQANEGFESNANDNHHSSGQDHSRDHVHEVPKSNNVVKESVSMNIWLAAIGSTAVISCVPFMILFFIPLDNSREHEPFLKVLLAFASGGLLGDAFLHLIPHALMAEQAMHQEIERKAGGAGHNHQHHGHSHGDGEAHVHDISVGLWVLSGILVFLVIEKVIRIIKGPGGHGHSHGGPPVEETKKKVTGDSLKKKKSDDERADSGLDSKKRKEKVIKDDKVIKDETENEAGDIKVAGYLNLAADFTHNLTDGLAIGASFLAGHNIGMVTAITILLHEVPHEIGDFAILIQSGCSRKKAMWLQLVTALGAVTGTVISLFAGGLTDTTSTWILPFTAGGFIYIATVSVIPELLSGSSLRQSIKEIFALLFGVFLMVLIATYE